MLTLFSCQFLLGCLFLLCYLLFWLWNNWFLSPDHLSVAQGLQVWADWAMSFVRLTAHLRCLVIWMKVWQPTVILSPVLHSVFLSMCSKISALFGGHWPAPLLGLVTPVYHFPPEWHTSLWYWWLFGYAYLLWPGQFHGCSGSEYEDLNLLLYMILLDFLGHLIFMVISVHLQEKVLWVL